MCKATRYKRSPADHASYLLVPVDLVKVINVRSFTNFVLGSKMADSETEVPTPEGLLGGYVIEIFVAVLCVLWNFLTYFPLD